MPGCPPPPQRIGVVEAQSYSGHAVRDRLRRRGPRAFCKGCLSRFVVWSWPALSGSRGLVDVARGNIVKREVMSLSRCWPETKHCLLRSSLAANDEEKACRACSQLQDTRAPNSLTGRAQSQQGRKNCSWGGSEGGPRRALLLLQKGAPGGRTRAPRAKELGGNLITVKPNGCLAGGKRALERPRGD